MLRNVGSGHQGSSAEGWHGFQLLKVLAKESTRVQDAERKNRSRYTGRGNRNNFLRVGSSQAVPICIFFLFLFFVNIHIMFFFVFFFCCCFFKHNMHVSSQLKQGSSILQEELGMPFSSKMQPLCFCQHITEKHSYHTLL